MAQKQDERNIQKGIYFPHVWQSKAGVSDQQDSVDT